MKSEQKLVIDKTKTKEKKKKIQMMNFLMERNGSLRGNLKLLYV
jgi:hypothetical protein